MKEKVVFLKGSQLDALPKKNIKIFTPKGTI